LLNTKNIFFVGLVVAASGLISTPLALAAGLIYGLSFPHPYHIDAQKLSAFLLKASIVGLGFGMNLHEVVRAGRTGFLYTALSISFAMLLGLAIGRLFKVQHIPSLLISTGTAICGGSAIAAVGPVLHAGEEEMAVSLGTVFVLNSVALFLFPLVGYALHLTQSQFGLWSALAIHDTSGKLGIGPFVERPRAKFARRSLHISSSQPNGGRTQNPTLQKRRVDRQGLHDLLDGHDLLRCGTILPRPGTKALICLIFTCPYPRKGRGQQHEACKIRLL
jgi:hypothetical protein